jgi:hypothetical protein
VVNNGKVKVSTSASSSMHGALHVLREAATCNASTANCRSWEAKAGTVLTAAASAEFILACSQNGCDRNIVNVVDVNERGKNGCYGGVKAQSSRSASK